MTGLWARVERCRSCGYRYERQPGFVLGATTMNLVVTFFVLAVVLAVGIVATWPDFAAGPIMVVSLAVCVLLPLLFNPISHLLWAAIDLAMHPLEPAEVADALAHAQGRGVAPGPRTGDA
jgi:uncharacterized protein (DUF983 family)